MDEEQIEIAMLLEQIYQQSGYDFRNYALLSIQRRIRHRIRMERFKTVSELARHIGENMDAMHSLIWDLTIHVTEMFRDPEVFRAFRLQAVPLLWNYSSIRIWHAGCSTGEEAYSMAILLKEEGLYEKSRIFATDIHDRVLHTANEGILRKERIETFARNYSESGARKTFCSYYTAGQDSVQFHRELKENIQFTNHNLAADRPFGSELFEVIFCRNVMIYFNRQLQNEVHKLLYQSLRLSGILALGAKESIDFSPHADAYEEIAPGSRLYRKIR